MVTCIPSGSGKLHFGVTDCKGRSCIRTACVFDVPIKRNTHKYLSWSQGVSKMLQIHRCKASVSPVCKNQKLFKVISSYKKEGSTKYFDFAVIGSGIAGLRYALEVAKYGSVAVITKAESHECNTNYAQGGVSAVLSPSDSVESHMKDTIVAGAYLCDEETVRVCSKPFKFTRNVEFKYLIGVP